MPAKIDTSNAAHKAYLKEVFNHHHFKARVEFEYFYLAQCVWEDTMAESIARHLSDKQMVVLAGNGHILKKFGIPDRAYRRTNVPFRTLYLVPVGGEAELSYADYIWITP